MSKIGDKFVFQSRVERNIERAMTESDFTLMADEPVLIKVQIKKKNQNEPHDAHNTVVTAEIEWRGQNGA
jgi:hypothetical protein